MELIISKNPVVKVLYSKEQKDKMIELGCYDKWKANMRTFRSGCTESLDYRKDSFGFFIGASFLWAFTPEGDNYWDEISTK